MICTHCSAPLDQEALFCPHCGIPTPKQDEELTPNTPVPQITDQAVMPTQEKLFLSDQPDTVADLNILHMYNSVPLPRPTETPSEPEQQELTILPTQPVPLETVIHPELVERAKYEAKDLPGKLSLLQTIANPEIVIIL
jgi:hypothetical protein